MSIVEVRNLALGCDRDGTGEGEAPAITLAHECSPMQTTHLLTTPRSAIACSQTHIQSVASRPGCFVHSDTPLNPGHAFVMICSTMDRLGSFKGSKVQRFKASAYGIKVVINSYSRS